MAADGEISNKLVQNRVALQAFLSYQMETWRSRYSHAMYERRAEVLGLLIASLINHVRNEWNTRMLCDETPFPYFKSALEAEWHATRQCEAHFTEWACATTIAALPKAATLAREDVEHERAVAQSNAYRGVSPIREFMISGDAHVLHRHCLAALMDYTNFVGIMYFIEATAPKDADGNVSGALRALSGEIYSKWLQLRHGERTKEDAARAIDDVPLFIKKLRELV